MASARNIRDLHTRLSELLANASKFPNGDPMQFQVLLQAKQLFDAFMDRQPGGKPGPIGINLVLEPEQLGRMAALGLSLEFAAKLLGVSRAWFTKELEEKPELQQAWGQGQAMGVAGQMHSVFQSGLLGDTQASKFWLKNVAGLQENPETGIGQGVEDVDPEVVHAPYELDEWAEAFGSGPATEQALPEGG